MGYKLGFIGCGIVGSSTLNSFRHNNFVKDTDIKIYDKNKREVNILGWEKKTESLEEVVKNSQYIFVSLPTPYRTTSTEKIGECEIEWGEIDLSYIDDNIEQIIKNIENDEQVVIIRSTVVPGTTKNYSKKYPKVRFGFVPEFLREKTAYKDGLNPDRIIIGADDEHTKLMIRSLYVNRFGEDNLFLTSTESAEMVKYMANITLATITIVANQMYDICNALDLSYNEIKDMVKADHRLKFAPLDVSTEKGFGGKCFPKDLLAMIKKAEEIGVDVNFLKNVWVYNLKKRRIRDWHEIPGARTETRERSS